MRALLVVLALAAGRQSDTDIIQRFLNRADVPLTRFLALRRLEARNERLHVAGWLEACTELSPESGFRHRIIEEGGNGIIRARVLRKALEAERDMRDKRETEQGRIVPENYELVATNEFEGDLAKILLKPRRRIRMLIDGAVFVSPADGDIVRLEGALAASPSFWTRHVRVMRRYDRIGAATVPVSFDSTAEVRIVGRSTFKMTYRYFSVNGQVVPDSGPPCIVSGPAKAGLYE